MLPNDNGIESWSDDRIRALKRIKQLIITRMLKKAGISFDSMQLSRLLDSNNMKNTYAYIVAKRKDKGFIDNVRVLFMKFRDGLFTRTGE